ncbi:MAG: ATP-binding cassette domain-containing protein [Proteobacteria bacterium]|nr:ATP-binding cassette domain-containing protein [Pseudomonadota bacterium]
MQKYLVELKGIKKHYPILGGVLKRQQGTVNVLNGIDLALEQGEITGLVGESGCGKSTLAKLLMKLEDPTAGEILFENEAVQTFSRRKKVDYYRQVQMIFQDPFSSLNPKMKIRNIIGEMVTIRGASKQKALQETIKMLKKVGLDESALERFPHEFSGGQRQRIAIARALIVKPKLLVADEPVSALDLSLQAKTLSLLRDLKNELNLTILLISHDLRKVSGFCKNVAVMYLGRIMETIPGKLLLENSRHPYSAALIDSIPVTNPANRTERESLITGEVPSPIDLPSGCAFHKRCPKRLPHCHEQVPELKPTKNQYHKLACFLMDQE